jgi:hypothetical protein
MYFFLEVRAVSHLNVKQVWVYTVNLCVLSVSCDFSNEFESFLSVHLLYILIFVLFFEPVWGSGVSYRDLFGAAPS